MKPCTSKGGNAMLLNPKPDLFTFFNAVMGLYQRATHESAMQERILKAFFTVTEAHGGNTSRLRALHRYCMLEDPEDPQVHAEIRSRIALEEFLEELRSGPSMSEAMKFHFAWNKRKYYAEHLIPTTAVFGGPLSSGSEALQNLYDCAREVEKTISKKIADCLPFLDANLFIALTGLEPGTTDNDLDCSTIGCSGEATPFPADELIAAGFPTADECAAWVREVQINR